MRYFYDCEFIEDGRTIDLVSIGMVDETGREFYAVSTEFDPSRAIDWVRRNVLDKLPPAENYTKAVFPTLDEQEVNNKAVTGGWDSVVGANVQ